MLIYSPAFKVQSVAVLNVGTITTTSVSVAGNLTGTFQYKYIACYDGSHNFRTIHSAASTSVVVASKQIGVAWASVYGALWYKVYRTADAGATYKLVYSGQDLSFTDNGATKSESIPSNVNTTGTTTPIYFDLRKTTTGVGDGFGVFGIVFEDQGITDSISINRNMLGKEFGVRAKVSCRWQVVPGSALEDTAAAIYGAKLAFPNVAGDTFTYGLRTYFAPDYAAGNPTWKEVRIIGNFHRVPSSGKNTMNTFEWELHSVAVQNSVPNLVDANGQPCW